MTYLIILVLLSALFILTFQNKKLRDYEIKIDLEAEQKNKELYNEIKSREKKINEYNLAIKSCGDTLSQLKQQEDIARQNAEAHYQSQVSMLQSQYETVEQDYKNRMQALNNACILQKKELENAIKQEQQKIDDLKAKQIAYIEARKRERQMEEQKDFYRLVISDTDAADMQALRKIQPTFSRKDTIDKLIWENYYKPAFDLLMGRLGLTASKKVSGIYKITNLETSEAYIGQSTDTRERWRQHIKSSLEHSLASNKLYRAMQKYGPDNFSFEILEEVSKDKLNEREVYWIDFFDTKTNGMNQTRGGS